MASLRNRGASTAELCQRWAPFKLPLSMDLQGVAQESLLLRMMPPEVMMHISQQADPVDRVSLALSCKELLAASQLRTLEVPHPMAHRAPWSADPAWRYTDPESVKPECQCGGLEKLLRQIRPKNPKGHADRTLHLCVDCLKYLPRRKSWWLAKREELGVNAYYGEVIFDWDHAAHNFSTGIRMQCPKCRLQEHGDLIGVETKRLFDFEDENPEFSQLLARLNRQVPDVAQPH